MAKFAVGMAFSREFTGNDPLGHINTKKPVYIRFFEFCSEAGWDVYILTRKTYMGNGIFTGSWKFNHGKFEVVTRPVKIDLVYDKSAGFKFPPEGDESVIWVDRRNFKILCWDKWKCYQEIGKYMPRTEIIPSQSDLPDTLSKIRTDLVVLKPANGLKGIGIFIDTKNGALNFKLNKKYKLYIAQEFVDTSHGISGITSGLHDLRIVVINKKVVWCHVRVPKKGAFKANVGQGGSLTEIDYSLVPSTVKDIVNKISKDFYKRYDSPLYSLDFGIGKDGTPKLFEINDQIGFPTWDMKARDVFLKELVENFKSKIH